MAQETNPVVHTNSPMPNKAAVAQAFQGSPRKAGASVMRGVTKKVHRGGK